MNRRHRRFVAEYLLGFNARKAARSAGYRSPNSGSRLLRRREVAAAIAEAEAEHAAKRHVTADRVLDEYARIAFADMRAFVDWGPKGVMLRDNKTLSEWEAGAIAAVEPPRGNGKTGRLKLYDKQAALETLARHTGVLDSRRPARPADFRQAGRDARAILLERLARLKKPDGAQS